MPLYTFQTIASAFFRHEYWLALWIRDQIKLNEANALRAAIKYHRTYGSRVAKTIEEYTCDSHTSSATNACQDIKIHPFVFNHTINKAWLDGRLDSYDNFPADFSYDHIRVILDEAADERATCMELVRWAERRKNQYRSIGCKVD